MLPLRRFFGSACSGSGLRSIRPFTTVPQLLAKPLPPRPSIDENDITEAFLKGTGPGGQKINKTSSAVQLKHLPTGIVIKCQETRSRTQNRKIARRILAERVEQLMLGDESRATQKAERAQKKKASKTKKAKRKYRKLAEGKEGEVGEEEEEEEDTNEGEAEQLSHGARNALGQSSQRREGQSDINLDPGATPTASDASATRPSKQNMRDCS